MGLLFFHSRTCVCRTFNENALFYMIFLSPCVCVCVLARIHFCVIFILFVSRKMHNMLHLHIYPYREVGLSKCIPTRAYIGSTIYKCACIDYVCRGCLWIIHTHTHMTNVGAAVIKKTTCTFHILGLNVIWVNAVYYCPSVCVDVCVHKHCSNVENNKAKHI